jgi:hypothetical protein
MAEGDIYCWLNSDDLYADPDVFQKVSYYFESEPHIKLLFGDGIFISKTGEQIGVHHVDNINLKRLLYLDYHILQPSTFFSADIFADKDLDAMLDCAFDADFFIRRLKHGDPYKKVNDLFGAFRYYDENKTIALKEKKYKESMEITRRYSNNPFFYAVSAFYRKAEILLHPAVHIKKGFKFKLFALIRRICYFLVTGKFK